MDERQIADYFVVAGLPNDASERLEEDSMGTHLKPSYNQPPIVDLAVIFPNLGEAVPDHFTIIDSTPTGFLADLNHGSLRSPEVFLCYRRGRDKPPLVDIGIMYEGKERILPDSEILTKTPMGKVANVNNSTARTFVTYRRAAPTMPCNALVVTDICIIITSKGEIPPHAFCVINKNLNKGMVGSDVFLCYKKSVNQAPSITYKPVILSKFPPVDRPNFPFPQSVPLFCLPMGATLEAWPKCALQPPPIFSTFVLTVSDAAQKIYGSAITFYEDFPKGQMTEGQIARLRFSNRSFCKKAAASTDGEGGIRYQVAKCICLLSHWPFFDAFERFLLFLFNMSRNGPHVIPIERYILHFMENVPFPSVQRPRILVQLSQVDRLILTQPEDLPLPRSGAVFHQMLMNLGPDNCLLLLLCALTEQKLLIHSLRPDVLTAVAEAVSMIIFPFKWQCPYIPLCPLSLAEVLHAPVPFLIGVDSRFFDLYDPPADVNCVDLDTNNITLCEEKRFLTWKLLPKKALRILRNNLDASYQKLHVFLQMLNQYNCSSNKDMNIDKDFQLKRKEQILELEIQEAFLRFMVHVLKGYRSYLLPITKAPTIGATDTNSLFDLQNFLKSRDKSYQKFYSLLTRTQMFIRFVEERSFVSDLDAGLTFFDECMEKMEQDEGTPHLLELDESHQSERTVFITPPELNGLSQTTHYTYQNGFSLNPSLFNYKDMRNTYLDAVDRRHHAAAAPGSPMARRTKYEVKSAQKLARKHYFRSPHLWAKCLLGTCFSLWFIHLPSYVLYTEHKVSSTLRLGHDLLVRIHKAELQPLDEICYRVMMQLCGIYNQPTLAVKLWFLMKREGIQPNAITYGFYNRAVLESKWPSDASTSSQLLWNKLRNVVRAAHWLKIIGQEAKAKKLRNVEDKIDAAVEIPVPVTTRNNNEGRIEECQLETSKKEFLSEDAKVTIEGGANISNATVTPNLRRASAITSRDMATFNKFCCRVGSIVKSTAPFRGPTIDKQSYDSSAGLLMTTNGSYPTSIPEGEEKSSFLDDLGSLHSTVNVRTRNKRSRSGSCTEIGFVPISPKNNRQYRNTYYGGGKNASGGGKQSKEPSTDCYQLLKKSESFANDAKILKNLRDIKSQLKQEEEEEEEEEKEGKKSGKSGCRVSKQLFAAGSTEGERGAAASLQKLKECLNGEHNVACEASLSSAEDIGGDADVTKKQKEEAAQAKGEGRFGDGGKDDVVSDDLRICVVEEGDVAAAVLGAVGGERRVENVGDGDGNNRTGVARKISAEEKVKSPVRTPVLENDPLGALAFEKEELSQLPTATTTPDSSRESYAVPNFGSAGGLEITATTVAKIVLDESGAPVLFGMTASNEDVSGKAAAAAAKKAATMPAGAREAAAQGSPFKTSLGGFKLPFSRYSPSRFSLRKPDLRIGTQMIENAITSFSPSSLATKNTNELLKGGLSSLKSAASSMAKKIDELKEAMSTPNNYDLEDDGNEVMTVTSLSGIAGASASASGEETPVRRKISSEFTPSVVSQQLDSWGANLMDLFVDGTRKGSSYNLQTLDENTPGLSQQGLTLLSERLYPRFARNDTIPVALEILATTCSKCHHCSSLIYDEDIMAGWLPEDSNLNTKCPFCDKATVPFLYVTILDYRSNSKSSSRFTSQESMASVERVRRKSSFNKLSNSIGGSRLSVDSSAEDDNKGINNGNNNNHNNKSVVALEPIIVPYLNPIVLRKELESILHAEGDACLTKSLFVDQHPIVYWNMVWFFERVAVTSHTLGLCLNASCVLGNRDVSQLHASWVDCDQSNVFVRTLWDNPHLHEEVGYPMYIQWNRNDKESNLLSALLTDHTSIPRSLMERVISSIQCCDLEDPIMRVAAARMKLRNYGVNHNYSLYKDILFLAFVALGRENIDVGAFDREYAFTFENLSPADRESKLFLRCDNPNVSTSSYFRHFFKELDLL